MPVPRLRNSGPGLFRSVLALVYNFVMSGFLRDVAVDALGELTTRIADFALSRWLPRVLPTTISTHRTEIRERLRRMPFIYKDLGTEVLTDFVEINIDTLDLETLQPHPGTRMLTTTDRVRARRKALFIGDAGMGKTTFFRHVAISLASRANQAYQAYFLSGEKLVPFYVPLKAVSNLHPFPIIRYLLDNYRYLSGRNGLERIVRLAGQRRVLLLLDGYDEIYVPPSGQRNFIYEELNFIFAGREPLMQSTPEPSYTRLGERLQLCRIWLSGRREFYQQHPLSLKPFQLGEMGKMIDFVALTLIGISSREALIEKIFDIYREREEKYNESLDAESFLHDIDLSGDEERTVLSYNPLFLTVMCYLYVHGLGDGSDFAGVQDPAAGSMSRIILECIDLLLSDLDEYRVRDLPFAQRQAFRKRRTLYTLEKREFLAFFAHKLIAEGKPVFTEDSLRESARQFFLEEFNSEYSLEIVRGLDAKQKSAHQFVGQLINQGLFVVDLRQGVTLYDFPHRRFREVLAARYVGNTGGLERVLANIGQGHYSEFLYVFFNASNQQDAVLREIFQRILTAPENRYFGDLALNCLRHRPESYNAAPVFQEFIRNRLDERAAFMLPEAMLGELSPAADFVEWLGRQMREGLSAGDQYAIAVIGPLLSKWNRALALDIIIREAEHFTERTNFVPAFWLLVATLDAEILAEKLPIFLKDVSILRCWCRICALSGKYLVDRPEWWTRVLTCLGLQGQVVLVSTLLVDNAELLAEVERQSEVIETISDIARYVRRSDEITNGALLEMGRFYALTRPMIRRIDDSSRERLRPLLGRVFASEVALRNKIGQNSYESIERVIRQTSHDSRLLRLIGEAISLRSAREVAIPSFFY
jgi:hypothetical protein